MSANDLVSDLKRLTVDIAWRLTELETELKKKMPKTPIFTRNLKRSSTNTPNLEISLTNRRGISES